MWWRTTHLVPNSTLTTLIGIMSTFWQRYMLHFIRTLTEDNCHLSYYLTKIFHWTISAQKTFLPVQFSLYSYFVRKFHPTFDNFLCWRRVRVVSEPPIFVNQSRGVWLWPKDRYIKKDFHGKPLETSKMVHTKVCQGVHFYITVSWPNSSALSHQNWGKTPHQNVSFRETLKDNSSAYNGFAFCQKRNAFIHEQDTVYHIQQKDNCNPKVIHKD